MKANKSKSCGCLSVELTKTREKTHGLSKTKFYSIWNTMVGRSYRYDTTNSDFYKISGITVCEEWLKFENFYNDMYESYKEGLWLERIDNKKGYCKENCKWETPSRQASNRKKSIKNKSGRVGVYFDKDCNKWRAVLKVDKKRHILGRFNSYEDACQAIEEAEILYLGYSREDF